MFEKLSNEHIVNEIKFFDSVARFGKIEKVVGLTIESTGPDVNVGDLCFIYPSKNDRSPERAATAEVVGITKDTVTLMPFDDIGGIGPGSIVESTNEVLKIPVGDGLMGRIIDSLGNPIDGKGKIDATDYYPVQTVISNPLARPRIENKITMGVKAIDGLLTCGEGQRIGIFAGSGVGKSTLLGMIARNVEADINVIALVGERGREVLEFIERDLKEKGMARSVVVVATSDQTAMRRLKCALTATTIAEYYKDRGKKVLLMMDSLTRFAMAQRDIGLSAGEMPVSKGYPTSLFALMPKLLERAGKFSTGSITGIYTVLVEGDDVNEIISDTVRGIIDGHIVLSRAVAMRYHYPAIDILASVSRLMNDIVNKKHLDAAGKLRNLMSDYYEHYDMISIGSYKKGTNPAIDEAINKIDKINKFLVQETMEKFDYEKTLKLLEEAVK